MVTGGSSETPVTVFWNVISCSFVDRCQCFCVSCYLHLQGRRVKMDIAVLAKTMAPVTLHQFKKTAVFTDNLFSYSEKVFYLIS